MDGAYFGDSQGDNVSPDQLAKVLRTQMAVKTMKEIVESMTEKCFVKCVSKPGKAISSSEQTCMTNCSKNFMEAHTIVSKSLVEASQKYANSGSFS